MECLTRKEGLTQNTSIARKHVSRKFAATKSVAGTSRRDILKGTMGLAGVGLASTFGYRPARAASHIKVKIINASGNFSRVEVHILNKLELFQRHGVDPQQIDVADGSKIIAGIIGGDGDICPASGFSGLFPAIEKGAAIKILAGSGLSPLTRLYSTKPEIKSVKDLPGHTVGVGAMGALLHELTVGVLKKYGVDYKTVKFVNIGSSNDVFKALAGGFIDAGAAAIEYAETADQYHLYPLPDGQFWKELPLYTNQAMYSSDEAIAQNRKGLIRVMASYASLFRWIGNQKNKPAFIQYYREALTKATEAEAAFLYDFVSKPGRLASGLLLSPQQIKYVQDLNVELGVQKAILPFDKCADMSLAQEALKLVA